MRQDIQILPDNRLFPTVMNINQGQNMIETALYSMENYVVNEVDLSTCDWYAVLMGVYGLDEVKLTHEVDEGVLKVRWNLNDYVTNIGQTLTYQIVAKNSEAAVYYTNKGIILNSQSIHADEFIVSNYPSILRQWEEYMKDLSGMSLDAYVIMDLGNYIPVHERVEGKFYLNRLTDTDYSCIIEDSKGNVITDGSVIHKTGNEIIEGLKRFTNNDGANRGVIELSNNNISYSETPDGDQIIGSLRFTDKDGETVGVIETVKTKENLTSILINVRNSNGEWGRFLSLSVDGDGFSTAYAPTPSFEANGEEIVNAAWVNNRTQPATTSTYGLMRVAAPTDEIDCSCNDASITPSNLYDVSNFRRANTEYNVDDAVGCPYHHNLQLRCTVAGTTSSESLNTKGTLEPRTKIIDGTVIWEVEELGTGGASNNHIVVSSLPTELEEDTFYYIPEA